MRTVKSKLIASSVLLAVIIAGFFSVNLLSLSLLSGRQSVAYSRSTDALAVSELGSSFRKLNVMIDKVIINRDLGKFEAPLEEVKQIVADGFASIENIVDTDEETALFQQAKNGFDKLQRVFEDKLVSSFRRPDAGQTEFQGLNKELDTLVDGVEKDLDAIAKSLLAEAEEAVAEFDRIRSFTVLLGVLIGSFGLLVSLGSMFWNLNMVLKPLEAQRELLKEIAQGEADLSKKLDQSRKDEFGELAGWFNTFTAKLAGIIGTVRVSAASLTESSVDLSSNMTETAAAVRQIAANIDGIKNQTINQSAGVTETQATVEAIVSNLEKLNSLIESQSSSVVESSASIEQMVANIRSVTQILQKNEASVRDLQQSAENGKDGMDTVSSLVQEILKESDGLLEASSVIQNIASQTNLLAMNAAIEAAHAGESGRGFAVVADEIRKLSEEAAAQGKTITQVMQKLKTAIDTVNGASQNAQKEFEQVFAMTRIVGEQEAVIKGAMDEQSAGGSQVLDAIRQINDITTDVKDGSDNMLLGSREVLREMSRLAQQTDEISNSMNEMSAGINQINSAVNHVNDISSSNTQNIEDLMGEFSRFKGV